MSNPSEGCVHKISHSCIGAYWVIWLRSFLWNSSWDSVLLV